MKEAADEGETKVDEVEVKVIKRTQSYDNVVQLRFFISYKDMIRICIKRL